MRRTIQRKFLLQKFVRRQIEKRINSPRKINRYLGFIMDIAYRSPLSIPYLYLIFRGGLNNDKKI